MGKCPSVLSLTSWMCANQGVDVHKPFKKMEPGVRTPGTISESLAL